MSWKNPMSDLEVATLKILKITVTNDPKKLVNWLYTRIQLNTKSWVHVDDLYRIGG